MQAKISYTVDIESIPSEVNKLIQTVFPLLEVSANTDIVVSRDTVLKSIGQIDELRKLLLQVDTRLQDCYSILVGYNRAVAESLLGDEKDEQSEQSVSE